MDVLNKITYDEYEDNQDKIYDVAEKILKGFKNSENEKNNIKLGLSDICEKADENKCVDFMQLIYRELSKENYSELYCEIRLLQQEKEGNKTSRIEQKVDEIQNGVKETNEILNKIETNNYNSVINQSQIVKKKSRTQEYADKWNANMFLNNFDKRDKNAGVNVKLKDVYLDEHLPHYEWGNNEDRFADLKDLLTEYIEEHNDNKMLLILGQPGIGKSTLITWITANFNKKVDDILVYQFASDLKNVEWEKDSITESILKRLDYLYNDLNGKILIFDGLDEWRIQIDKKNILDNLYEDLIYERNIKCFTLIVTCRENYIQGLYSAKFKYIVLKPWNEMQIKSFCSVFQNKTNVFVPKDTMENIISNKNILGIPLVLYMVLALNITFENEGSIVDVYDRVFSLEGGIYDRCIDHKRFASPHRIGEIKRKIHQISREITIWMFENNPDEAYIPQEEYKKICTNITYNGDKNKGLEQDFIIGNFFKLKYCEGEKGEELYFVHRSIYEYFVVEIIYNAIENSMKELSDKSQEELAANIAVYLKQGEITNTIGEYLQYKIMKFFKKLNEEKKERFYAWWESAVDKMLNKGMFYYTNKNIFCYKNIIEKECNCFENILKILRLLSGMGRSKYMLENIDREILEKYIRYCMTRNNRYKKVSPGVRLSEEDMKKLLKEIKIKNSEVSDQKKVQERKTKNNGVSDQKKVQEVIDDLTNFLDLSQMDLWGVNFKDININRIYLNKTNLRKANFEESNLKKINLEGANLEGANLKGANLEGADLSGADIRGADLSGAILENLILKGTIIDVNQIDYLETKCDLQDVKVSLSDSNRIVKYEDYCKKTNVDASPIICGLSRHMDRKA